MAEAKKIAVFVGGTTRALVVTGLLVIGKRKRLHFSTVPYMLLVKRVAYRSRIQKTIHCPGPLSVQNTTQSELGLRLVREAQINAY